MVVTLQKIPIKTPYCNTKTHNLNSEHFMLLSKDCIDLMQNYNTQAPLSPMITTANNHKHNVQYSSLHHCGANME